MPEIPLKTIINLPLEVNLIAALLAFAGILSLTLCFSRLRKKHLISASIYSLFSVGTVLTAIVLIALSINLYTYNRINHEQDVAEIEFKQIGPQQYLATIFYADGKKATEYIIRGDEWQLDARIIKWKSPVYLAGLNSLYRLERISGRYRDVNEDKTAPRSVYSLAKKQGLDLWSITKKYPAWMPWVDAYYGSATYLPMGNNTRFKVTLSQTGLISRPVNEPGEKIIQFWD